MTVALSMRAAAYLRDFDTAATELRLAKDVARVHADQVREDDHTKYPEGFGSPLWDGRLRISGSADIHVAWLAHHYEEMVARYCNVAMTALTRTVDGQPVTIDDLRDADNAYRARSPVMPLLPPLPTREQLLALTEGGAPLSRSGRRGSPHRRLLTPPSKYVTWRKLWNGSATSTGTGWTSSAPRPPTSGHGPTCSPRRLLVQWSTWRVWCPRRSSSSTTRRHRRHDPARPASPPPSRSRKPQAVASAMNAYSHVAPGGVPRSSRAHSRRAVAGNRRRARPSREQQRERRCRSRCWYRRAHFGLTSRVHTTSQGPR